MSEPKSRTDFLKAIRARTSALKIQTEIPEDIRRASISNVHQQIENSISKAIVPGNYLLPSSAFHEQDPDGTTEQETGDMFVDEDFDDVLLQAEEEDEEPPLRSNSSSDLYINGVYYPLHEWMGADFVRHIRELHNTTAIAQPAYLATQALPHQLTGVAKLNYLLDSNFKGAILADEMGLGKTLTVGITCVERIRKARGCHTLIVTTKTCQAQWAKELTMHFKQGEQPRVFQLTDPTVSAEWLINEGFDFVIVTYQFLAGQYRNLLKHENLYNRIKAHGLEAVQKEPKFDPSDLRPVNASIFSPIYKFLRLPCRQLILDEAQLAKAMPVRQDPNSAAQPQTGITHEACNAVYRSETIVVTGTPMGNKLQDVASMLDFLSGHPFKDGEFQRIFPVGHARRPNDYIFNLLTRFLMGVTLARPSSILHLQGMQEWIEPFDLTEDEESEVTFWVLKYLDGLRMLMSARRDPKSAINWKHLPSASQIMQLIQRAQMCAGNRNALKVVWDEKYIADEIKSMMPRVRRATEQAASNPSISQGLGSTDSNRQPTRPFGPGRARTMAAFSTFDAGLRTSDSLHEQIFGRDYLTREAKRRRSQKDRFAALNSEDQTAGTQKARKMWLESVRALDDDKLYSSRIKAFVELHARLRLEFPGRKMAIFSQFLTQLDLVCEAMDRRGFGSLTYQFNGTMDSIQRAIVRSNFDEANAGAIMLITAGAGGAGMNLVAASIVILLENWWNANVERQAIFRVLRPGQTEFVHVFQLQAENSMVDMMMAAVRDSKINTIDEAMAVLRREDDEEPKIPFIVPTF